MCARLPARPTTGSTLRWNETRCASDLSITGKLLGYTLIILYGASRSTMHRTVSPPDGEPRVVWAVPGRATARPQPPHRMIVYGSTRPRLSPVSPSTQFGNRVAHDVLTSYARARTRGFVSTFRVRCLMFLRDPARDARTDAVAQRHSSCDATNPAELGGGESSTSSRYTLGRHRP